MSPNIVRIEHLTVQAKAQLKDAESPLVLAVVSVTNNGYRSSATKWRMQIRAAIPVQEVSVGAWRYVEEISDVDWSTNPPKALANRKGYDEADYIGAVTARPIERGERPTGFFLVSLSEGSDTMQDLYSIKVLCEDFKGNVAFASIENAPNLSGSIYLGEKHAGQFPPYGFKELPAHPDWTDR